MPRRADRAERSRDLFEVLSSGASPAVLAYPVAVGETVSVGVREHDDDTTFDYRMLLR